MSRTLRRNLTLASLLGFIVALESAAHADTAPESDVFLLNTACIGIKDAFKSVQEPSRLTGAGAFDANLARLSMPDGAERFVVAYDDSGQWRQNSAITPKFALVDLTKDGLRVVKKDAWLGSAVFNKERLFMRPSITVLPGDAQSPGYFLMTGASEDNGTSGNPRTTVLIYDANGEPILNVVGTSRGTPATGTTAAIPGKTYGPRGERGVDMGAIAGRDNNEQQGASDVKYIGKDPQGRHLITMAFQENNRAAYVALYAVEVHARDADAAAAGATITPINNAVMLQGESRHCRPTCALAEGTNPATFACSTVHANEQPAEKGITVGRFDARTGALIGTAIDVVAPSLTTPPTGTDPVAGVEAGVLRTPKGFRFSQSELRCADAGCSAYALQTSHLKKSIRTGGDGHTPTAHTTDVLLLDRDSLAVTSFASIGNFAHTYALPLNYGAGGGQPALGILSAPLSGMKPASLQVLPIEIGGKKIAAPAASDRYNVSYFSNAGDVVARGLRNPRNQGRGFLFASPNVPNPGANGGWMAGISAFTAVAIPTFGTQAEGNFMGLDLCFVPSTHLPAYTKTAPGKVIRWNEAPVGAPPDPAHPNAAAVPTAPSGEAPEIATSKPRDDSDGGGCAVSQVPGRATYGGVALAGLAALMLVARRRRGN